MRAASTAVAALVRAAAAGWLAAGITNIFGALATAGAWVRQLYSIHLDHSRARVSVLVPTSGRSC